MNCVVGIDSGGTKTACCIMRKDGNIIGQGQGIGTGYLDEPEAFNVLKKAFGEAFDDALRGIRCIDPTLSVSDLIFTRVFVALGGLQVGETNQLVEDAIRMAIPAQSVLMDNDIVAAHWAAFEGKDGIVATAGTGVKVYGLRKGAKAVSGGWGHYLQDEGSGYSVGYAALLHSAKALDGRIKPDLLSQSIMESLQVRTQQELRDLVISWTRVNDERARIAALAKNVVDIAKERDRTALGLLANAGAHIADYVSVVAGKLRVSERFEVRLCGGLTDAAGDLLLIPFLDRLRSRFPDALVKQCHQPPVYGAALAAWIL